MVDCGSPRCSQERRSFRRDLQSWNKKLCLVLGLEKIASSYVNEETSQQLLNPYPEWEQQMTQDYVPHKRCFHCNKKLPNIYKRIKRITQEAKRGKEGNGRICLRSLQDLMPFCIDFYIHEFGRELFSDVVKEYFLAAAQQVEAKEEVVPKSSPYIFEIDGNKKIKVPFPSPQSVKNLNFSIEEAQSDRQSEYIGSNVCGQRSNLPHCSVMQQASFYRPGKRNVIKSEPEEIVIEDDEDDYIPLRQRVNPFECPLPSQLSSSGYFDRSAMYGLGSSSMLSPVPPTFMPYPMCINLDMDSNDLLLEHRLAQIRRMHNLNGSSRMQPRPAHSNQLQLPLLSDVVRKLVHQRFNEIKKNYGPNSAHSSNTFQEQEGPPFYNPFLSYMSAFSPYLFQGANDENLANPLYKHLMENIFVGMMGEESQVPKPFGKVNESSRIGDTLKDIITKSISERMRFREASSDENSVPSSPDGLRVTHPKVRQSDLILNSSLSQSSKETLHLDACSPPKRVKRDSSKASTCSESKGAMLDSNGQPVKKTRPKRGQYRKYNSQLLMDAVKAVQRGEMSVHRAGSYFGVPHSTLEYKVKERHLLRQKKPGGSQSPSMSVKSESTTKGSPPLPGELKLPRSPPSAKAELYSRSARSSTSSGSPPTVMPSFSQAIRKSPVSTLKQPALQSTRMSASTSALSLKEGDEMSGDSWYSAYLASAAGQSESTQGFNPTNLSLNNSASELLRKLQHKVQTKEAAFSKGSAFDLPLGNEHVFGVSQASGSLSLMPECQAVYNHPV